MNLRGGSAIANRRSPTLFKKSRIAMSYITTSKIWVDAYGGAANGIPRNSTRSPVAFPWNDP